MARNASGGGAPERGPLPILVTPGQSVGPFAGTALRHFVSSVVGAAGASKEESHLVAEVLVDAEERGYDSQGLIRLPVYVNSALKGQLVSPVQLEVRRQTAATFALDAHDGWGAVVATRAMTMCIEKARDSGACVGVVENVGHIGRLGYYVELAAEAGLIGILCISGNPGSATMAPWGGREARLSTNPLAIGFPHPGGAPIVVDISTTQAARGKVLLAAAKGESIPDGWAFDADGNPSNDANRALPPNGTLAPLGGHKGYALAVAVEMLSGGLAGSYPPRSTGMFIGAIQVDALTDQSDYAAAVVELERAVGSSALRPGFNEVMLPGAGSARRRRLADANGVTVAIEVWRDVLAAAARVGVEPLAVRPVA